MTTCFWWTGEYERAVEAGRRAWTIACAIGDLELRIWPTTCLGQAYFYRGEFERAVELFQRNVELLRDDLGHQVVAMPALPAVGSLAFIGMYRMSQGDFARAPQRGGGCPTSAETADHHYSLYFACYSLGSVHSRRGDQASHSPGWTAASSSTAGGTSRSGSASLRSWLGLAWALTGRIAEALALVEQAARQVAPIENGQLRGAVANALAEVYRSLAGWTRRWRPLAPRCNVVGRSESRWPRLCLCSARSLALSPPEPSRPRNQYRRRSRSAADSVSGRSSPIAISASASSTGARANVEEAQEHLTTATTMYREMGMRGRPLPPGPRPALWRCRVDLRVLAA